LTRTTKKSEYQWAITLIRQRGKFLGSVEVPDPETAIKHFEIKDPEQQKRLVAQRQSPPGLSGSGPACHSRFRATPRRLGRE
jgi:hypothetical protein